MAPYNLHHLYSQFSPYSKELVLYLPRNSDLNQIARYSEDGGKKLEVAHYAIMGASKVCLVFSFSGRAEGGWERGDERTGKGGWI